MEDGRACSGPNVFVDTEKALASPEGLGSPIALPSSTRWRPKGGLTLLGASASSIAEAFRARAERIPARAALFDGTQHLSYAELAARTARAAAALRARGVPPGARVGVALPRSIDAVVATLATWSLGATVVPLDATWPKARRERVAHDAELAAIVDNLGRAEPAAPSTPPPGEAPALVLFTSGSTGPPKGVMLGHSALLHRIHALALAMPFSDDDIACHRTPLTFVDAYAELFGPLLHGVPTFVLPEPFRVRDLVEALSRQRVTRLVLVPSLLALLLDACPALGEVAPALRLVVSSGEPLTPSLARRFQAAVPRSRLVNVYGSTEVAGDATAWEVPRPCPETIAVGSPLDGVTVEIVGDDGQPVVEGAVGEILVGGPILAAGYWKRPELTAERFVRDPRTGARLFRTGDRARRTESGALELLGRGDDQVKVAGVRIELGEIESALLTHGDVREVAAAAVGDERGQSRIVAAAVVQSRVSEPELRRHAAERLPSAAIPSAIAIVEALPRNAHGKIDRAAIAAFVSRALASGVRHGGVDAPADELATRLAAYFGELTGRTAVGVDDDFESIGGDSMGRLRLLALLDADGMIFAHGDLPRPLTARALAAAALAAGSAPAPPSYALDPDERIRLGPPGREMGAVTDAFPLTDFQSVMVLQSAANRGSSVWCDQVAYSIQGPLDVERLERAFRAEVAEEPALRTRFAWKGLREPLQVVHASVPFSLDTIDCGDLDGPHYRQRVLAEEWHRISTCFDLTRPPLFAVRVLVGRSEQHDLVLTYHHAILDGESARRVLRNVLDRYMGRTPRRARTSFRVFVDHVRNAGVATRWMDLMGDPVAGGTESGAKRPIGGGDAVWRAFHRAVNLRADLARLRVRTLRWTAPDVLLLLRRSGVSAVPYAGGELLGQRLPVAFARALRAWSRSRSVPPTAIWAALYAIHLARDRASNDVLFGVIVSGRDGRTLETIGMLANCLPLRVHVDPNATIGAFVTLIHDRLRELEALGRTPLLALARQIGDAFLDTWFVSWSFALDRRWEPPEGLRIGNGRGVTLAVAKLALVVANQGEAMHLGVGADALHRTDRVRLHLLALADALLDAAADARVEELLRLPAPDGGMSVGLPDL